MRKQTTIKIDKSVPMPAPRLKYPLSEMKVGNSFLLTGVKRAPNLGPSARRAKIVIAVRKVPKGYRVWRIK